MVLDMVMDDGMVMEWNKSEETIWQHATLTTPTESIRND